MSKLAYGLIFVCALVGLVFFNRNVEEKERLETVRRLCQAKNVEFGKALYARSNIPEGTLITKDLVVEREISIDKIPGQALTRVSEALQHKARFAVTKGFILSRYDLDPYPPYLPVQAVTCVKRIPRGVPITDYAVELTQMSSEELPANCFLNAAKVLGRTARYDIEVGQIILSDQVVPRRFERITTDSANKPR